MESIREGASGAAVEDIQERLGSLGYAIASDETSAGVFGKSTGTAVARFRLDHDLPLGDVLDAATWSSLVDECYQLGDRTLYLRLPNFHGNDVRQLQERLTILGFSCGTVDGSYGVHTEAAVKQFQESVGALADGMAFPDTFDAIERLRHVWAGKPANGPHPQGGMGFARAAGVLEGACIAISGDDPISRNVAGRIVNLANATSDKNTLELADYREGIPAGARALILLSATPLAQGAKVGSIDMDDLDTLPLRLRSAYESARGHEPVVRIELPVGAGFDGTFTTGDAQTYAVLLLDAVCTAFDGVGL